MTLTIELPIDVESALRIQFGGKLEERAKEDLAAAWFSEGRITARQVAGLLGMSLFDAHAFLKNRGASLPMTFSEVESDFESLRGVDGS